MTFLDEVARALVDAGRAVEVDAASSTIDVSTGTQAQVLAVVRPLARAVTFYVVHPVTVPPDAVPAVSELLVRATADLLDAALELDLSTGAVATRYAVVLGDLELPQDELAELLGTALEVVQDAADRYTDAIDQVLAGTAPATAASAVRRAGVEDLAAQLDG